MMAIRVKGAADILGVSPNTVRNYCKQGILDYDFNAAGQRVFDHQKLIVFKNKRLGITEDNQQETTVFYIRSSNGNDVLLSTQEELLTKKYGTPYKIYKDKASGLSETRRGLKQMIKDAQQGQFTHIAVTNKDRLTRFGYSYLESLFHMCDVTIVTLDDDDKTKEPHEVLMQDFMNLIASFSGKFYRLRGYENQRKLLDKAGEEIDKRKSV